jgi:hypothetical protein
MNHLQDNDYIGYSNETLFGFERVRCRLVPGDEARKEVADANSRSATCTRTGIIRNARA